MPRRPSWRKLHRKNPLRPESRIDADRRTTSFGPADRRRPAEQSRAQTPPPRERGGFSVWRLRPRHFFHPPRRRAAGSRRDIVIAGASPTRIPVRRQMRNAQASTREIETHLIQTQPGRRAEGADEADAGKGEQCAQQARYRGEQSHFRRAAAARSVAGLAPSVARMAISRARPTLRASDRLATLAAAMRSTQNTAPASIHNASRDLDPTKYRLNGTTLMPRFRSAAGNCSSRRRAMALISAWA